MWRSGCIADGTYRWFACEASKKKPAVPSKAWPWEKAERRRRTAVAMVPARGSPPTAVIFSKWFDQNDWVLRLRASRCKSPTAADRRRPPCGGRRLASFNDFTREEKDEIMRKYADDCLGRPDTGQCLPRRAKERKRQNEMALTTQPGKHY
jgi:hypothetical protein